MRTSTVRRASMVIVTCAALAATATLTGCASGPTTKEDFAGDIKAMGYKLEGSVSSEKEKKSALGLAPMAFELPASSAPKKNSDSKGSGSSTSSAPKDTSTKIAKPSTSSPTPSATKTAAAPQTVTVLEVIVDVDGCNVELERLESATKTVKTVGSTKIQDFWVDEVNGVDALGAPTDAPTVKAVKQYLAGNNYACFTG